MEEEFGRQQQHRRRRGTVEDKKTRLASGREKRTEGGMIGSKNATRKWKGEKNRDVRLSRRSCMIRVASLYDSSLRESRSVMASSKACLASAHACSGRERIS